MNYIVAAIVLAGLALLLFWFIGRDQVNSWPGKVIAAGCVILLVVGVLVATGLLPFRW